MNRYKRSLFFLVLAMGVFAGCSTSRLPVKEFKKPVNYSIVYLIHGDANYLYHNKKGQPLQADKQILQEAKWVGRHAQNGEVFIYHLKPETKILYFFPRKDRRFLYYRNGELVYKKNYSPHSKTRVFSSETKLYQYFHQPTRTDSSYKKILLYFGHEIPVRKGTHYFQSRPDASFNTALFAQGIGRFLQSGTDKFDLAVLSTCDNGTPLMIHDLAPFTRYILASPFNLHLSHIDTKTLHLLERQRMISTQKLASKMATDTFKRLTSFLQTVISLTLYDIEAMGSYLNKWANRYNAYLSQKRHLNPMVENKSCSLLPLFNPKHKPEGVKIWYRPPRFGNKRTNRKFLGWGCR